MHLPYAVTLLFGTTLAASRLRTVYQFPNPTWVENIASTRNGSLLVGFLGQKTAQLHIVDPFFNATQDTLLHTFPFSNAVFGITEYEDDVFAVAVANLSLTTLNGTGDADIWSVDLRCSTTKSGVKVKKLAHLPNAQINGIAALNSESLLFTDSWAGRIGRVDIKTGKYEIVLQDATTANNLSASLPLGANGLKVLRPISVPSSTTNPTLYYSNLQLGTVHKVQIDPRTGRPRGRIDTLAKELGVVDDLAVTDDGTVFVVRDYENDVVRVEADGEVSVVGGADSKILGPTAAVLGRTYKDRGVVYPFEEETLPYYSPDDFYPVRIGDVLGDAQCSYKVLGKLGYGCYSTTWLYISPSNIMFTLDDESILHKFEEDEAQNPSPTKVIDDNRTIYGSHKLGLPEAGKWGLSVLCDFGASRIGDLHKGLIQPKRLRAPEILFDLEWSHSVDVWNLAVLTWDFFENRNLFKGNNDDGEYSPNHHMAEMVAYLGVPPQEYLQRSEIMEAVFDEQGRNYD
ncbi:hypothetical protein N0V90_005532 [Kalmusia sp. IMI 367209]|nr:hypothetical protein N0V90_005532 [Kalmusia sp. IMI 367209]